MWTIVIDMVHEFSNRHAKALNNNLMADLVLRFEPAALGRWDMVFLEMAHKDFGRRLGSLAIGERATEEAALIQFL